MMTTIIRFETMIKRNMSQNRLQIVSKYLPHKLGHVFHHPRGVYRLRCCKPELDILSSILGGTKAILMALVKLVSILFAHKKPTKINLTWETLFIISWKPDGFEHRASVWQTGVAISGRCEHTRIHFTCIGLSVWYISHISKK